MSGIIHDITKDRTKAERECFDIQLPYQVEVYVTQAKRTGTIALGCLLFQVPTRTNPLDRKTLSNDDMVPEESFKVAVPFTSDPNALAIPEGIAKFMDRVIKVWTLNRPANMRIRCRNQYAALLTDTELSKMLPGRPREAMAPVLQFIRNLQGGLEYDSVLKKLVPRGTSIDVRKVVRGS